MSQVRIGPRQSRSSSVVLPPSEDGLPSSVDSSTSSRGCAGCPLGASALQTPAQVHYTCMFPEIVQVSSVLTLTPFMATTWSCPCPLWSRHFCLDKTFLEHWMSCGGAELFPASLVHPSAIQFNRHLSHKQWCLARQTQVSGSLVGQHLAVTLGLVVRHPGSPKTAGLIRPSFHCKFLAASWLHFGMGGPASGLSLGNLSGPWHGGGRRVWGGG